jgi:hypothetical protein
MNPISNNSPINLGQIKRTESLTATKQAFLQQLEQLRANSNTAPSVATSNFVAETPNINTSTSGPVSDKNVTIPARQDGQYRKGMVLDIKV